jgi:hypothetical protein
MARPVAAVPLTRSGACQCRKAEFDGTGCRCEWAALLLDLRKFAYRDTAPQRADQAVDLADRIASAISRARGEAFYEWAKSGARMEDIGAALDPPISRQRVSQVIKAAGLL